MPSPLPVDQPDWRWECVPLRTRADAEFHLRGLMRGSDAVRALRHLLAGERVDVSRLADAVVIADVAVLLARGRLVLHEVNRHLERRITHVGKGHGEGVPSASPAPAASPRRASPPPSPVAPLSDPELDEMNQDAQAATLRAAARGAVPFCEVCAKAARARELAAA